MDLQAYRHLIRGERRDAVKAQACRWTARFSERSRAPAELKYSRCCAATKARQTRLITKDFDWRACAKRLDYVGSNLARFHCWRDLDLPPRTPGLNPAVPIVGPLDMNLA